MNNCVCAPLRLVFPGSGFGLLGVAAAATSAPTGTLAQGPSLTFGGAKLGGRTWHPVREGWVVFMGGSFFSPRLGWHSHLLPSLNTSTMSSLSQLALISPSAVYLY